MSAQLCLSTPTFHRASRALPRWPALRTVWPETITDFPNPVHRLDDPSHLAKGWPIGSGPVESAYKTVVGLRLKGPGLRWCEPGSDGVCRLRALFLGEKGQWDAFWDERGTAA